MFYILYHTFRPNARGVIRPSLSRCSGRIISYWRKDADRWRYEITTPMEAEIVINENVRRVPAGSYVFYSPISE